MRVREIRLIVEPSRLSDDYIGMEVVARTSAGTILHWRREELATDFSSRFETLMKYATLEMKEMIDKGV